ncbi:TrmH family RNA methyltransferase [Paenibacillus sp. GYB003]|uniref:TrmH family RNA methyltransferase n=1 Tax=Paenibacillus sp. GYB003 TaxID=2994392 RepID=UPI002F961801
MMRAAEPIVSPQNPKAKMWAQLLDKKGRDKRQAYLVEGIHLVQEALKSGADVETVLYSLERGIPAEIGPLAAAGRTRPEWVPVSEQVLAKCTDAQTPQPVAAIVNKTAFPAERLLDIRDGLVVVVDGVQDPGNLGTIVRSADAVGASAVLLGKGTVDLYNPKTVRSTMGSLFHLPIAESALPPILSEAKRRGVRLINTSLQAKRSCYETDLTGTVWIVLGNEGKGVSPEVAEQIDEHVVIPMKGPTESLNVAMAATVLLFEAMRQRGV